MGDEVMGRLVLMCWWCWLNVVGGGSGGIMICVGVGELGRIGGCGMIGGRGGMLG